MEEAMAKKRHLVKEKEKEEEYTITPSDFDEKEFILKSIYSTKVLLITIVFATVIGIIASFICKALDDEALATIICTIIVFAFVAVMKKLYRAMGIRVDLMDNRSLLGDYLIFLILALGVCIVFINAPFD